MIIIGEKLNSSISKAYEVIQSRNESAIVRIAKAQVEHGADFLDVNTAMLVDEAEALLWAVKTITEAVDCPIMVDTPNPDAARYLYENVELENSIINSISLEPDRFEGMVEIALQYDTGVVAMPISPDGMPSNAEERIANSKELIAKFGERGISHDRIYVDVIAEAAGAAWEAPYASIQTARALRSEFPDLHITAGVSNVSYGLPERGILNRAYLCCLMANGMDSCIINPLNTQTMLQLRACEAMLGQDEYCMEYITACRSAEDEDEI